MGVAGELIGLELLGVYGDAYSLAIDNSQVVYYTDEVL